MAVSTSRLQLSVAAFAAIALAGCAAPIDDSAARTTTVTGAVGQQVILDVRSIMNTAWDSVPQLSSAAVRFVSEAEPAALYNPGGPAQRFTFAALAPGRATVTLRRDGTGDVATYVIEIH
jgi:hypothetical protein